MLICNYHYPIIIGSNLINKLDKNKIDNFEYNSLTAEVSLNDFITKFKFIEENGEMGDSNVFENEIGYKFNEKNYLSFMSLNGDVSCIPITNSKGELISSDRYHLTYAGTEFFGPLFFKDRNLINILSD